MPSSAEYPASADAQAFITTALGSRTNWRLLIDGRSGAGKTTLARALAAAHDATLVSLDEVYPGWGGLREGGIIATESVLRPHASGKAGHYRRFDWELGTFRGAEVTVDPNRPLVVEGCGSAQRTARRFADLTVWVDGDAALRKQRALSRDGETFAPHWDDWTSQEELHMLSEAPHRESDVVVDVAISGVITRFGGA